MNRIKKLILISVLTAAFCLSAIVGSTYALFTDQLTANITVTSGTVEASAYMDGGTFQYKDKDRPWPGGGAGVYEGILKIESMESDYGYSFNVHVQTGGSLPSKWQMYLTSKNDIFKYVEFSTNVDVGLERKSDNSVATTWQRSDAPEEDEEYVYTTIIVTFKLSSYDGAAINDNISVSVYAVPSNVPTDSDAVSPDEGNTSEITLAALPCVLENRKFHIDAA